MTDVITNQETQRSSEKIQPSLIWGRGLFISRLSHQGAPECVWDVARPLVDHLSSSVVPSGSALKVGSLANGTSGVSQKVPVGNQLEKRCAVIGRAA